MDPLGIKHSKLHLISFFERLTSADRTEDALSSAMQVTKWPGGSQERAKCGPGGWGHQMGRAGWTIVPSECQRRPGREEGQRGNGGPFGTFIFIHDLGKCSGNTIVKFSNDANTGGIQLPEKINIQKNLDKLECWAKKTPNPPAW